MRGRKKKIPGAVEQTKPETVGKKTKPESVGKKTKPEPVGKKLKPKPVISVEPQDEFVNRLNH